jgi:hypothetical protein
LCRNLGTAGFGVPWMLQDKGALQVSRAVQSGGQSKVPLKKGTDAPKPI